MVKMYRYMAERTLMALCFVRGNVGNADKSVTTFGQQHRRNAPQDDELSQIFYEHFDSDTPYGTPFKIEDLINNLKEQIQQLRANERDETGDLIERIVSILGMPYARNQLSGRTMDHLRRALLLPQELSACGAALTQRELSCVSCGRSLRSNEMATVYIDHNHVSLMCFQCLQPSFAACGDCQSAPAPIDKKLWKKGFHCGCVERKQKELEAAAAAAQTAAQNPAPDRITIEQVRTQTTTGTGGVTLNAVAEQNRVRDWAARITEMQRQEAQAAEDQHRGQPFRPLQGNNLRDTGNQAAGGRPTMNMWRDADLRGPLPTMTPGAFIAAVGPEVTRRGQWVAENEARRNGLRIGDRVLPLGAEIFHGATLDNVTNEDIRLEVRQFNARQREENMLGMQAPNTPAMNAIIDNIAADEVMPVTVEQQQALHDRLDRAVARELDALDEADLETDEEWQDEEPLEDEEDEG